MVMLLIGFRVIWDDVEYGCLLPLPMTDNSYSEQASLSTRWHPYESPLKQPMLAIAMLIKIKQFPFKKIISICRLQNIDYSASASMFEWPVVIKCIISTSSIYFVSISIRAIELSTYKPCLMIQFSPIGLAFGYGILTLGSIMIYERLLNLLTTCHIHLQNIEVHLDGLAHICITRSPWVKC